MSFIVKITTLLNPLDLLAPHTCRGCGTIGKPLCDCCKKYILKHHCNLKHVYCIGKREGLLKDLIHDFKYNSVRALDSPLAEMLASILPKIPGKVIIVPLPTISRHVRERGLDHTKLIAKRIAKIREWNVEYLLIRDKNTVQVGADKNTRTKQAEDAYMIKPSAKINPSTTYILLDDVLTTGASMKAAKKKLQVAGASKIIECVLAVS